MPRNNMSKKKEKTSDAEKFRKEDNERRAEVVRVSQEKFAELRGGLAAKKDKVVNKQTEE